MRRRDAARWVLLGLAGALAIVLVVLLYLTQTDAGRERVRELVLSVLDDRIEGEVSIGRIEGDLLDRITLIDVTVTDEQGRPFLEADTIGLELRLVPLLRKRIQLHDVRIVNADVVVDEPPGEDWNYVRIFSLDEGPGPDGEQPPGWGDWLRFDDVEVVNSDLTVRTEWEPDGVSPAERDEALAVALSSESRENVIEVPGGHQNVMEFRSLNARLPRLLAAHPDSTATVIEVGSLAGVLFPFEPPPAVVHDMSGVFRLMNDSLYMEDVDARLPGSRLTGEGVYSLETGDLILSLDADPASFADLRWLAPRLPTEGGGTMHIELHTTPLSTRMIVTDADVRVAESHVTGRVDVTFGDSLRLRDTDLSFERLDTRLVERMFPDLAPPVHGHMTGDLVLAGTPASLEVDGDVTFDALDGGVSRVVAEGEIDTDGPLRFTPLRLRFAPLQASLVRAADGDAADRLAGTIEGVATLSGVWGDMALDADLTLRDPQAGVSRIAAEGGIDWTDAGIRLQGMALGFDPLQADWLRRFAPDSPLMGTVTGTATLTGVLDERLQVDADLTLRDPRGGPSRLIARGGLDLRDELRFVDLDVRADPLHLDIFREELPDLPAGAIVAGSLELNGPASGLLQVDGALTIRDPVAGESELGLRGGIRTAGGIAFQGLAVEMDPLRLSLLPRIGAPEAPIGGTLVGSLVLDGDPQGRLAFEGDVVHELEGERSAVAGSGVIGAGADGRVTLDLGLQPLSLETAGRFFPELGLHGDVRGSLVVEGVQRDLRLRADLQLPDGGALAARGTVNVAGEQPSYDLSLDLRSVDLASVSSRAPEETDLTGELLAVGYGVDPATMDAHFVGNLRDLRVDETVADAVRFDLVIEEGLAVVDTAVVHFETAVAVLEGSFGLVAGREGVLAYDVRVDSLHALAPWLPGADSAVVPMRPAARATAVEAARDARERAVREARVESLATGRPMVVEVSDTIVPVPLEIPSDSVAGRVHAVGELRGNVERFDVMGAAELEQVVYSGSWVGEGALTYALTGVGAPGAYAEVEGDFESVIARGFAYDSLSLVASYTGEQFGSGELHVEAFQDAYTDVAADVRFTLAEPRSELYLDDVRIRTDTVTWQNTQVGVIAWGGEGTVVEGLDLRSDTGARLFVDGRIPVDGDADFRVVAEDVRIEHVEAVVQADLDASGVVDLDARVMGPRGSPVIVGTAELAQGSVGGTAVERAFGSFEYADLELTAEMEVWGPEQRLARADVRLPIDLSLEGVEGSRLLDRPLVVDVDADSLSIAAITAFAPEIQQVEGYLEGDFRVRGTFDDPELEGAVVLDGASMTLATAGITLTEIGGRLSLEGDRIVVDSLLGMSGGPIRVTGAIDVSDLRAPEFDLDVVAFDALVLDNDEGRLVVDATLDVRGPFEEVLVTGTVRTRRGEIDVPELSELGNTDLVSLDEPATFERVDTLLQARRDLLLERHPLLSRLDADVDVTIDRDVWLRSLEANVEIYTPPEVGPLNVRLDGAARRLLLEGTINTDRGYYEFMSRPFQLTRGAVTFRGDEDLNALLQVVAEHEVRMPGRQAFAIRALLGGSLREPTVSLESSAQPPISQTDLLTYVAFGSRAASVLPVQSSALSGQGAASGDLVGNVAALATQQLTSAALGTVLNELEGEATQELGVDVFRITPADLPEEFYEGRFDELLRGTEVEVGAYMTPRLFGSVQGRATGRPGLRLEYLTPSRFRWTAAWLPRYLPSVPSFTVQDPKSVNAFGFLFRKEWRF